MMIASVQLAADLLNGGQATVVGDAPLVGAMSTMTSVDGQVFFARVRKEQPGVRVRMPNDEVHLYACLSMEHATALFERGHRLAAPPS